MPTSVITTAADLAGRALARMTRGVAALRSPAAKPLHPDGEMYAGRLVRPGSDESVGVPWIDEAGEDAVSVRLSRAIGLPGPLPDVQGLALRLRPGPAGPSDLLLASTGWDPVTRHLLVPAWNTRRPLTSLLPYRSPAGPLLVGARPVDVRGYELCWALVGREWHHLGDLTLDGALPAGEEISFDPVLNPLPGLEQYPWVERLREQSYATARRLRRASRG
ncbi:hypothetical protein [Nocardioides daeguensis]|uniref:Phosphodiesterase n=1 Tax=Nocardioides daeguensis TaxID=908359 RepID=A0ABP6UTW6_9ACTN|nr:hypothetical protein [Nocardioides daeguensis]MBV6729219.1 hypothetical protein [Nocardioides daeguensis]MCR1774786.1 hypothetical protein [Nocardioides daeguensis]